MANLLDSILSKQRSAPALGAFSVVDRLLTKASNKVAPQEEPAVKVELRKADLRKAKPEPVVYQAQGVKKPRAQTRVEQVQVKPVAVEPPSPGVVAPAPVDPQPKVPVALRGTYGDGVAELASGAKGKYWANKEQGRIEFEVGGYRGYFISPKEAVAINQQTGEAYSFEVGLTANSFDLKSSKELSEAEKKALGLTQFVSPAPVEPLPEPRVPVSLQGTYGDGAAELESGGKGKYWANKELGRIEFDVGGYRGYFISATEAVAINQTTGEAYSFKVNLTDKSFALNESGVLSEARTKELGLRQLVE